MKSENVREESNVRQKMQYFYMIIDTMRAYNAQHSWGGRPQRFRGLINSNSILIAVKQRRAS